jgi:uncharacterized protein (DUF58 family)
VLTRSGLGVGIGSALLLVVGWRWSYLELAVLGAVGLLAVLLALVSARRGHQLEIRRRVTSARVTRGDELPLRYNVRNGTGRRQPSCTLIDTCADSELRIDLPPTPAKQSREWVGAMVMRQRGVYTIGPLATTQTDVLSLAAGQKHYSDVGQIMVQPRARLLGPTRGLTRLANDEAKAVRRFGDPLSGFHSLRPYVTGDDTRLIHWASVAKTGDLMVREFVDSRRPQFSIVLDVDAAVGTADDFEEAVDVAASVAVAALRDDLDVVVRTTERANAGRPNRLVSGQEVLDLLTRVGRASGADTVSLAGLFTGGFPEGVVIVVTGPNGPAPSAAARRSDVRVIRVGHGAAVAPSLGVTVAAADADTFAQLWTGVD